MWSPQVMVQGMRGHVALLEEKNALAVFCVHIDETEQDKRDNMEFLALTRAEHLRKIREPNQKPTLPPAATIPPVPKSNDE